MARNVEVRGSLDFMTVYSSLDNRSQLKREIDHLMDELKREPNKGDRVEKRLWPRKYVREYGITNLFRYRLGAGYRLTYTISSEGSSIIVTLLLDILDHKEYDRLFGYHSS